MSIADGDPGAYDTLILGIGNILWADEGFGIRALEACMRSTSLQMMYASWTVAHREFFYCRGSEMHAA